MSEEKRDRIIVRPESPQPRGDRKPLVPRQPLPRSQDEIESLADKVAENHSLMQLFNSGMGSNDAELASRVLEKIQEEIAKIDPTARNTDGARVMAKLMARAHRIKVGGR